MPNTPDPYRLMAPNWPAHLLEERRPDGDRGQEVQRVVTAAEQVLVDRLVHALHDTLDTFRTTCPEASWTLMLHSIRAFTAPLQAEMDAVASAPPPPEPALPDDIKFSVLVDLLRDVVTGYRRVNDAPPAMVWQALTLVRRTCADEMPEA